MKDAKSGTAFRFIFATPYVGGRLNHPFNAFIKFGAVAAFLITISACGAVRFFQDGRIIADDIAASAGWRKVTFDVNTFVITGYFKKGTTSAGNRALTVYIEGDGRAFINRRTPSRDPTPRNPMGLRLAAADPKAPLLYLSRPCQFTTQETQRECQSAYWTTARFAPTVITALNEAITQAQALTPFERLHLVGYSGGGAIAVLLASRRADVASIITAAGNLDHRFWTEHHQITPLYDSLNSADVAQRTAHIPQIHFAGGRDKIVPPVCIESYLRKMAQPVYARLLVIPELGHHQAWVEIWPMLIAHYRRGLNKSDWKGPH